MHLVFKNIKAILFDLDGTLLDSAPDLGAAANKMRLDRGLPKLPFSSYRPMVGTGARGMLSVAFNLSPEDANFDTLKEEFFVNYASCLVEQTREFDGVTDLIFEINRIGIKWAVVTNKSERFTKPLTSGMPVFNTAGAIVSGDTTPYAKPHPAPLLEAARRLDVLPVNCIYIGDDERDIVAGRAAGMQTVAAAYGYLGKDVDILSWKADAMIVSPIEVLKLLEMP